MQVSKTINKEERKEKGQQVRMKVRKIKGRKQMKSWIELRKDRMKEYRKEDKMKKVKKQYYV